MHPRRYNLFQLLLYKLHEASDLVTTSNALLWDIIMEVHNMILYDRSFNVYEIPQFVGISEEWVRKILLEESMKSFMRGMYRIS